MRIAGGGHAQFHCAIRAAPDPHYGRAGGLALFALRKICHPSHRLLLRKMEKVLQGISNAARLDGVKACQQLLLTHLARRGRPRVLRLASNLMQNGVLSVLAEGPPRLLTPRCALNKEKQRPISLSKAAAGGVQKGILSFVRAEQYSAYSLMAPHGVRGRSPGDLWVLSIPGKYRAADMTSHRLLPSYHVKT